MNIDYKFLIPTIVSGIAALFAILSYRRNRRFNNENYLFEKKVESYSIILQELDRLIVKYERHLDEFKIIAKIPNRVDQTILEQLNQKADELEESTDSFVGLIISKSLVLPENIVDKLDQVQEILYESTIPGTEFIKYPEVIKKTDQHIETLLDLANEINDEMRNDLNIEKLNNLLYKRLE